LPGQDDLNGSIVGPNGGGGGAKKKESQQ